jgi:hypothetical protein
MAERFYPGASSFCLLEQPIENSGNAALRDEGAEAIRALNAEALEKGLLPCETECSRSANLKAAFGQSEGLMLTALLSVAR